MNVTGRRRDRQSGTGFSGGSRKISANPSVSRPVPVQAKSGGRTGSKGFNHVRSKTSPPSPLSLKGEGGSAGEGSAREASEPHASEFHGVWTQLPYRPVV